MHPAERAMTEEYERALKRRDVVESIAGHWRKTLEKQDAVVQHWKKRILDFPRSRYWSHVSTKEWPIEIVHLITRYCGIAVKLFLYGSPSDRALIDPRILATLHVKYALLSRDVARYTADIKKWFDVNYLTVSGERPKWKKPICTTASLREMALRFPSPRFVVRGMTMTLLGVNGIVEFDVGPDAQKVLARVKSLHRMWRAPLVVVGNRIVVAYNPPRPDVAVLYGGRGATKRIVKVYKQP